MARSVSGTFRLESGVERKSGERSSQVSMLSLSVCHMVTERPVRRPIASDRVSSRIRKTPIGAFFSSCLACLREGRPLPRTERGLDGPHRSTEGALFGRCPSFFHALLGYRRSANRTNRE